MFYVTNAPETYDYGYCSTFMTVTGTNGRGFRVLRVRDVKRFENFQIPRYQSGFVYATFSLDDPKAQLLLGCQVLAEIQKAIEKRSDPATLKSDRVRFNWGYHDGAAEQRRDRVRDVSEHYDQVYAAGYLAGVEDQAGDQYDENSERAWGQYSAA